MKKNSILIILSELLNIFSERKAAQCIQWKINQQEAMDAMLTSSSDTKLLGVRRH
jgi:hypothetical protein